MFSSEQIDELPETLAIQIFLSALRQAEETACFFLATRPRFIYMEARSLSRRWKKRVVNFQPQPSTFSPRNLRSDVSQRRGYDRFFQLAYSPRNDFLHGDGNPGKITKHSACRSLSVTRTWWHFSKERQRIADPDGISVKTTEIADYKWHAKFPFQSASGSSFHQSNQLDTCFCIGCKILLEVPLFLFCVICKSIKLKIKWKYNSFFYLPCVRIKPKKRLDFLISWKSFFLRCVFTRHLFFFV